MSADEAVALLLVSVAAGYLMRRLWRRLRPNPTGPRRQDLIQVSFGKSDAKGR